MGEKQLRTTAVSAPSGLPTAPEATLRNNGAVRHVGDGPLPVTWEDVEWLAALADELDSRAPYESGARHRTLADRIASLLPLRSAPGESNT